MASVWVQINWQTGAQEQFCYRRRVSSYAVFAGAQALEHRVRELNAAGLIDAQIAATLEREGYQTPGLVHPITSKMVWHLRDKWKIPTVKLNKNERNPAQWEDGSYSVEGAAAKLGVDQIDLLILHQALPSGFDRTREAYRALETLLADSKVRAPSGLAAAERRR